MITLSIISGVTGRLVSSMKYKISIILRYDLDCIRGLALLCFLASSWTTGVEVTFL